MVRLDSQDAHNGRGGLVGHCHGLRREIAGAQEVAEDSLEHVGAVLYQTLVGNGGGQTDGVHRVFLQEGVE